MKTGWLKDGATWYYLNQDGSMKTGWFQDTDEKWYYLAANGAMAVNTTIDNYNVGADGSWIDNSVDKEKILKLDYEMKEENIDFYTSTGVLVYKNTIKYPYFHGNSTVAQKLNKHFLDLIQKLKDNNTDFDEYYEYGMSSPTSSIFPYYEDLEVSVGFNDRGVISLVELSSFWLGGAHPYHSKDGIIYDLNTNEELTYSDIIDGTDEQMEKLLQCYWLKRFFNLYGGYIRENPLGKLKEYTNYSLLEEGLCFYYNVGDSLAREEMIIPYTDINTYKISAEKLLSEFDINMEDNLERKELTDYIDENIYNVSNTIKGMVDANAITGTDYTNGDIIISSDNNDKINLVCIENECDYCILGIHYGATQESSRYYLIIEKGWWFVKSDKLSDKILEEYMDDYGNKINLYSKEGKVIAITYSKSDNVK